MCMCVCMRPCHVPAHTDRCRYTCVSGVLAYVCTSMWRPEINFSCHPSGTIHLGFWQGFLLAWNSMIQIAWLASKPRSLPISASSAFRITTMPGLFAVVIVVWILGIKFRFSYFQGKHFANWGIFPVPISSISYGEDRLLNCPQTPADPLVSQEFIRRTCSQAPSQTYWIRNSVGKTYKSVF